MIPSVGVTLGTLNPRSWLPVALEADRLGLESVWMSDHLVAPVRMDGELHPGRPAPLSPTTPLFDAPAYLCFLAGQTSRVRLGTFVYLLGLRHPLITARAFATLDVVSGGRARLGAGAGWLTMEWAAAGVPAAERGARLDEAIEVCRRLWREPTVEHPGPHFPIEPVGFEPKPVQPGGVPILVGGESATALRRAAHLGDGWAGMSHTPDSAAARVATLRTLRREHGRENDAFEITVSTASTPDRPALEAFAAAGVDRVIVSPWTSSRTAVEDLRRWAGEVLPPGEPG